MAATALLFMEEDKGPTDSSYNDVKPVKADDTTSNDSGVTNDIELQDLRDTEDSPLDTDLLKDVVYGDTEDRRVSPTSSDSGISSDSNKSGQSADSQKPLLTESITAKQIDTNGDPESPPHVKVCNNSEGSIDSAFCLKVFVIFVILDVLLIATIFVVAFGIPCLDSSAPEKSEHCLNCMDVYLTEDDKLDNIYNFNITGENKDICCAQNETLLIQKYVIKRYRSDQAKASAEKGFPKRTAIHLDLDKKDINSIDEGENQVLKWAKEPELMYGDLSLSEDRTRIRVGREGLYYISPRVVFDDKKGDVGEAGLDPMSLQLYRVRVSGERQLLLETKETHCANSETKCARPSSTQGVFKLEKGDSIEVTVTKPCGLVLKDKLNHFDMYLI